MWKELWCHDCFLFVELGSLTTANLMEKVRGLQNLAYQLGLEECEYPRNTHPNQWMFQKANSCSTQIPSANFPVTSCHH